MPAKDNQRTNATCTGSHAARRHLRLRRGDGRKAVGVDPEIKEANRNRLRRIEGQIRGLQKMVEDERYCADIITQVASVQEALRGVARNLMRNHLRHCAAKALRSDKREEAEACTTNCSKPSTRTCDEG